MTRNTWQRARACTGNSSCVDILFDSDAVRFRDGKLVGSVPRQEPVSVPLADYEAIRQQVLAGNSRIETPSIVIETDAEGPVMFKSRSGTTLDFSVDEWLAFSSAIADDDFAPIK